MPHNARARRCACLVILTVGALAAALLPGTGAEAVPAGLVVRTGGVTLNVRSGPAVSYPRTGGLVNGTRVAAVCQLTGQPITGRVVRSAYWDLLVAGGYVAHAYVAGAARVPLCSASLPTDPARYAVAVAPLARE